MGDSDNTTPLSFVTRRTGFAGPALGPHDLDKDETCDRAVAAWRDWHDAYDLTGRLCREQQLLERKLVETVGFPRTTVLRSNRERIALPSVKGVSEKPDAGLGDAAVPTKAEADFGAHQARWDTADREIGYSAAVFAEHEAANRAEALLDQLSKTPATTLAGVAAKLDAVLKEGQPSEDDAEFPWPQIRSAFENIARIRRQKGPS